MTEEEEEEDMPQEASYGLNDPALQAWIKRQMNAAVHAMMARGLVDSLVVEARPAWVLPCTLLIGKIRPRGQSKGFDWFICGDAPLTYTLSSVAATPREAARHFALQWQLDAARQGAAGNELAQKAGALYQLVDEDIFWQQEEGSE